MDEVEAKTILAGVQRLLADEATVKFLEGMCHFRKPTQGPQIEQKDGLVAEGRRQVYLTLLTVNECSPQQMVKLYTEGEM